METRQPFSSPARSPAGGSANVGVRPVTDLVIALFGPIVWAAHFSGLYFIQSLLCTITSSAAGNAVRWIGAGLTVVALAASLAFIFRRRRDLRPAHHSDGSPADSRFRFAAPLAALSMLAIAWSAMPLLFLPACSPQHGGRLAASASQVSPSVASRLGR